MCVNRFIQTNETDSSSYYYGSTTPYAEFWPSQLVPSIFYPGQGSSNLALTTSVYLF